MIKKIFILIIFLSVIGFSYFLFVKQQKLEDSRLKQLSVIDELSGRFQKIKDSNSIEKNVQHYSFLWIDEGYYFSVPTVDNIMVSNSQSGSDTDLNHYFPKQFSMASQVLEDRGYKRMMIDYSTSTFDYGPYEKFYVKDSNICKIDLNIDINYLVVACSDISAEIKAKAEQKPIIDSLNYKGKHIGISIISKSGIFFQVSEWYAPGGQTDILKKEGNTYRLILRTQESPYCSLMDKEKIPKEVLTSIGNGGCYLDNGTEYRKSL
jgi:hypothetical protein